jgi:hypothetical protein
MKLSLGKMDWMYALALIVVIMFAISFREGFGEGAGATTQCGTGKPPCPGNKPCNNGVCGV